MSENILSLRQIASWGISNLRSNNPTYPIASIPSLQRGLVWNSNQTEFLWDSLLRGFPVGAFVLCLKLQRQMRQDESAKYDLLDGQQRAHAIGLGFDDIFASDEHNPKAILWIDLEPKIQLGTRTFLFRVTTEAHPWGYCADDAAKPNPLPISEIRTILIEAGRMINQDELRCDADEARRRPSPRDLWPAKAKTPIPFAWLMKREEKDSETFWRAIRRECEKVQDRTSQPKWAQKALNLLNSTSAQNASKLQSIWRGVKRAREAQIVWLEVSKDALMSASAQEEGHSVIEDGQAEITSVEHLFYRLNAGGTRLDGDELAYSMIKAHWPELKKPISDLASRRKLPEARLATLAARVALVMADSTAADERRRSVTTAVSVSDFRRLAYDMSREEQRGKLLNFFGGGYPNLAAVLNQLESWLELDEKGVGLPPVLQTSIARNSRDVYALLLWIAARSLQERSQKGADPCSTDLRIPVLGLATALHWFGEDKRLAVDAIAKALNGKTLEPTAFDGLLTNIFKVEERLSLHQPFSIKELEQLIECPKQNELDDEWNWNKLLCKVGEEKKWTTEKFLRSLIYEKELLIYAQGTYIVKRFQYDPARQDMWDQHNRPWDFDHIIPSAVTYNSRKSKLPYKSVIDQWIGCIGNLRACPMEENRSDQHISPKEKLSGSKSQFKAFLLQEELNGFQLGYDEIIHPEGVLAFMSVTRKRLIRIYSKWYNDANISGLIRDNSKDANVVIQEQKL